jgi:type I restriction enzyme S subunit
MSLPHNWIKTTIGDIAKLGSGTTPSRAQQTDYFDGGNIPWVKTGDLNNETIHYINESITEKAHRECSCKIYPPGTLLVAMYGGFNQIGRTGLLECSASINQALTAISLDSGLAIPEYVQHWLNSQVEHWKRLAGSSRKDPNITKTEVAAFPIYLPPLNEQQLISNRVCVWDRGIRQLSDLIAAKVRFKQGLMQQLLTGKRRFPGFNDSWDEVKIGDIAVERSERNRGETELPVLSCTKYAGLVDSLTYFGKRVFSEDTSNYKIVRKADFAYATNHIEEGSIGLLTHTDAGLVSPMYTVFKTSNRVVPEFLYRLVKTETYRQIFASFMSASVNRRGSLRWKQFSTISIRLPSFKEQIYINEALAPFDREIELLRQELEALKAQKKGLMQKLLTGQIRVPMNQEISLNE